MTPTLSGRLQTRIFVLATVGVFWTLVISLVLPDTGGAPLDEVYETTFGVLLGVAVIGLIWELIYHLLQQFRWEKDWPIIFGLLTGINEGIVLWFLIDGGVIPWIDEAHQPTLEAFAVHFITTWLVVWLFLNGPVRVFLPRWRFRGGEII